jgi:uncharacterized membrane-anchored protein
MKKNFKILALIILIAVQLSVPIYMIANKEYTLTYGKTFKFQTRPVDPYDAFRGKYVALNFSENPIFLTDKNLIIGSSETVKKISESEMDDLFFRGRTIFVSIKPGKNNFAKIDKIHFTPPDHDDYFETEIYNHYKSTKSVTIVYPFNRYYMDEFKAPEAEKAYWQVNRKRNFNSYALVKIKKGDAVIEKLMLEDLPIEEYLKKKKPKKK